MIPRAIPDDNSDGRLERSRHVARKLADAGITMDDLIDQLLMRKRLHIANTTEVLFARDLQHPAADKLEQYVERKMAAQLGVFLRNNLMIEWTKRDDNPGVPGSIRKVATICVFS